MSYFTDNYKSIRYPYECGDVKGLRKSQLGAIHAIAAHFTNSNLPAVITMPTGSGKTAILMLSAYVLRATRVLIITPSRLVRSQMKEEFKELSTLIDIGALVDIEEKPKVHELESRILSESDWSNLENYDVVVAIPMSISPAIEEIPSPPNEIFDLILIDEAHHSPATTWNEIMEKFPKAKKILFTATPFRRDKKDLKGKFIYNYAISDAYKDGVFGRIEFIPVLNKDIGEDIAIAKKTQETFESDKQAGLDHLIMVRTDSKKRAKELREIYKDNTTLNLQLIDSDHTYNFIKSVIRRLIERKLDGIICVNMLGEGFNLPNLKIAAIHSPHKSLEVTLQFIGRFARTNATGIGLAKFIAIPSEIQIEKEKLFEEGAMWQDIIMHLSESRINEEIGSREILSTFDCTVNKDDETDDLSLLSLNPFTHVRIYSSEEFNINSDIEFPINLSLISKYISEENSMVILITKEIVNPKWTKLNMFQRVQYDLFVVYYNTTYKLLFINASRKNEDIYKTLSEQFAGSRVRKLPIGKINRVLTNLKNPEFFNIGMRNSIKTSNTESYRIISGANAQKSIHKTDGRLYHRGHCFGKGVDNNIEVTVGFSSGSKVWCNSYLPIPNFIKWCNNIACKISNTEPIVTHSPLDFLPVSEEINALPENDIIAVDWNSETYLKPQILWIKNQEHDDESIQLLDFELKVGSIIDSKVEIIFKSREFTFSVDFSLNSKEYYHSTHKIVKNLIIYQQHTEVPLLEYLNEYPLAIYFNDFSSLVGNEYYKKIFDDFIHIDDEILEPIDWDANNVDIQREFGLGENGRLSIQKYINEQLVGKTPSFIYYDHGTGEIADFITANEGNNDIVVQFYHCKGSGDAKPGDRVGDIYDVSGQVIKSTIWTDLNKLTKKLRDRDNTHTEDDNPENFRRDNINVLMNILKTRSTKRLNYEILLVQPGISKSQMSTKISSVIAAADDFCVNQGYSHIKVLCSM